MPADADALLNAWMLEELERNPVRASSLGLEGYDDRLGEFGAAKWREEPGRDRRWAGRLSELPLDELPLDTRIDVALVLSHLSGRAAMEDWEAWRRDPALYLDPCLQGVFSLFLHRLRPEAELVAAAASRLAKVPQVLAAGRANLEADLASPLVVERAMRGARAGATWWRDLLPGEVADPSLRADLAAAAGPAAEALDDFCALLGALVERARGDWALGEARYTRLLTERELLGFGATDLHEKGEAAWAALNRDMTELAVRLDPDAAGWHEVVARLGDDHPAGPDELLAAYDRCSAEARQFLVDRDLVSLPEGERCEVEPSPLFQRPVLAVASYNAPPAFSDSRTGHFFVPFPAASASPQVVEERMRDNNHAAIPTITAHEAYPGHHWQLTWSGQSSRRVRHLVRTPYFTEGWGLYAERVMWEEGFFADPRQELGHLDARIFRAARIVVDTALHCGDMTVDQAVEVMQTRASLTESVARAEVARYCAWPTQAASYLTGSLEIERLRNRWQTEGRGSLRAFHDTVAVSPGLPVALVERELFGP
ncbi:MAG: DUF885 domain-containing protein [Acidimicrobiaceae bacterium]|nr:DUF885 domain-containing protein [Acidimicrobiaceae bacterium]